MRMRSVGKNEETIELNMTAMIDIVFQLLIFFIMTFKIVVPEGDFNIKMPLNAPAQGPPDENQLPPMKVRIRANTAGELTGVQLNERKMNSSDPFGHLRSELISLLGDEAGLKESAEVELDCDYELKYQYVIQAISAVSGYITAEKKTVKLIEKIKFAPPKNGS